jgi:hypothetical protein
MNTFGVKSYEENQIAWNDWVKLEEDNYALSPHFSLIIIPGQKTFPFLSRGLKCAKKSNIVRLFVGNNIRAGKSNIDFPNRWSSFSCLFNLKKYEVVVIFGGGSDPKRAISQIHKSAESPFWKENSNCIFYMLKCRKC